MKSFRWGMVAAVVLGVVAFSGCQMPFKCISRGELENFRRLERLNSDQAIMISNLMGEAELLETRLDAAQQALLVGSDLAALQQKAIEQLEKDLAEAAKDMPAFVSGLGETIITREGPGLRFVDEVLFDTGQATLKPGGEKIMQEVAALLADTPNKIRICGFTDSQWTGKSQWKSNFELSGARALSVLNFLTEQGIPADRMHFAGYGEHALLYGADGSEDMDKSRRAEIILLNEMAVVAPALNPK